MKNKSVSKRVMQKKLDDVLQNVVDIFEADDGRSFEEKKKLALSSLSNQQDALLGECLVPAIIPRNSFGTLSGRLARKLCLLTIFYSEMCANLTRSHSCPCRIFTLSCDPCCAMKLTKT